MKAVLRGFGRSDGEPNADPDCVASRVPVPEMARAAAAQCIARSGVAPEDYDLVIIASESFWDVPGETRYAEREYRALRDEMLHGFANDLGLARAVVIGTWMSACGNAMPALDLASSAVASGRSSNVLVVSADRAAPSAGRMMPSGLAVFSDLAAAVTVSNGGEGPELVDVLLHTSPGLVRAHRSSDPLILALELRKGLSALDEHLQSRLGRRLATMDRAIFENLRPAFIRSAADTVGLPPDRVRSPGHSAPGHAFSADLILALEEEASGGGARATGLTAAISLASWTLGAAIVRNAPA